MCDYEPDLQRYQKRKARKQHTCNECRLPIPKGCQYWVVNTLYDGSWETHKIHIECDAEMMELARQNGEFCSAFGDTWPNGAPDYLVQKYKPKMCSHNWEDTWRLAHDRPVYYRHCVICMEKEEKPE